FAAAFARLGVMFGVDYLKKPAPGEVPTADVVKVRMLYDELVRQSYTDEEFTETFNRFMKTVTFPNWSYGEFFKHEKRIKLHTRAWAMQEHAKDATAFRRMEAYKIPGVPGTFFRYADG